MDNLVEGKRLRRNFNARLDRLRIKVRSGDNQAAIDIIKVLTEMNIALKAVNCRLDDVGKIHLITPEWIAQQLANETEMDRLHKKARGGDPEAIRQLIHLMAEGE